MDRELILNAECPICRVGSFNLYNKEVEEFSSYILVELFDNKRRSFDSMYKAVCNKCGYIAYFK